MDEQSAEEDSLTQENDRPEQVRISAEHVAMLRDQARSHAPNECCGVLLGWRAGTVLDVREVVACENVDDNPRARYTMAPRDLARVQREGRDAGLDVVGFYHSHPHSAPVPSRSDIAEAYWADFAFLIVGGDGEVRAWLISESSIELEMMVPRDERQ